MADIYDHRESICKGTKATHITWGAIGSPFTNSGEDAGGSGKEAEHWHTAGAQSDGDVAGFETHHAGPSRE